MSVAITCAACRRTLRVPADLVGQTVRCPLCIETFVAVADPVQPPLQAEKPAPRSRIELEVCGHQRCALRQDSGSADGFLSRDRRKRR